VRFTTPARAAPECAIIGIPRHISATMFTIAPPWSRIHWTTASRDTR
jgi:hypothetical protein